MESTDSITLALTGMLPFVILIATLITPAAALLLLHLYRRAVLQAMNRRAAAAPAASQPMHSPHPASGATAALSFEVADAHVLPQAAVPAVYWRVLAVYLGAGGAFALVLTLATLIAGEIEISPVRTAMLFLVYAWPLFLVVYLDGAMSARVLSIGGGVYLMLLVVLGLIALARSPDLTVGQLVLLWLIMNLPGLVIVLAFTARPVRAIGPLVVLFLAVLVAGPVTVLGLVGASDAVMHVLAAAADAVGLGAASIFVLLILASMILFAPLGWLLLGMLRRAYLAKRLNDKTLTMDAVYLLFALIQSILLAFEGPLWVLSGVAAFGTYKVIHHVGLSRFAAPGQAHGLRLLLLRVFSLGRRSQQLFDAVTRAWRYQGSVQLIVGPDLATTTVDPDEFLQFVSGRLGDLFITGEDVLARRMQGLDTRPDIDGRYRVNDFFCHDDTWQQTLSALVRQSDVVLMDLRGFTPQNAGCVYELTELVNVMPLSRIVLVIDGTTDREFAEQTLTNAWVRLREGSPNRALEAPVLRLVALSSMKAGALRGLSGVLQEAATAD